MDGVPCIEKPQQKQKNKIGTFLCPSRHFSSMQDFEQTHCHQIVQKKVAWYEILKKELEIYQKELCRILDIEKASKLFTSTGYA